MKKSLFILCCMLFSFSLLAVPLQRIPAKFDVAVSFGSMAGGPSSDAFLKSFVKNFKKKYGINLIAYKAAGCGREGEFNILFSLSQVKSTLRKKFIHDLNKSVIAQEKKNKAIDEHSGGISVEYNKNKKDFDFCREGIKIWK